MNSYIIAVDENGQAYLSHAIAAGSGAGGGRRGVRQNHKYILKIGEGRVARYFYTPEEVAAYKRELQSVAKKAVQPVKTLKSDLKKRQTWKNAEKEANSPWKSIGKDGKKIGKTETDEVYANKLAEATKKTYDKTKLGKAENALISKLNNSAIVRSQNKKEEKNNKEREALEKAGNASLKRANFELNSTTPSQTSKKDPRDMADLISKYDNLRNEETKAWKEYKDASTPAVIKTAKDAVSKAKSKTDRMKEEFRNKTSEIKDKIGVDERERREEAEKALDKNNKRFNDAYSKLKEYDASHNTVDTPERDKLNKEFNDAYSEGFKTREALNDAEKAYDKTALGKVEGVVDKVKDIAKDAYTDADLAAWEAGKKVKDAGKSVKEAVDNAAFEVEYAAEKAINNVTGNKDAAERDYYLKAIKNAKKEAEGAGENPNEFYYKPLIERLQEKADAADKRYKNSTVGKLKTKADRMKEKFKK